MRAESDVSLYVLRKTAINCLVCTLYMDSGNTDLVIEGRKQTRAPTLQRQVAKHKSLPTLIVRSRDAEYNSPSPPQMIFSTESACPERVTSQRPVRVFQI